MIDFADLDNDEWFMPGGDDTDAELECKSAVLVFEHKGTMEHRFCTVTHGELAQKLLRERSLSSRLIKAPRGEAQAAYAMDAGFRDQVDTIKHRMAFQQQMRDTLTRNGVPNDPALRMAIYKSISELKFPR